MPCILAVLALFVPRIVIVLLWLLSTWFDGLFDTIILPVIGFLLLPTTLLWYSVVLNIYDGAWDPVTILVLVLAFLIDISPASGRRA